MPFEIDSQIKLDHSHFSVFVLTPVLAHLLVLASEVKTRL